MASRQRPKRRKTVPSAKEQQAASVRSLDGVEAPLKPTDVEAAHERREQARAVEDMASHAATASQLGGQCSRHREHTQYWRWECPWYHEHTLSKWMIQTPWSSRRSTPWRSIA